MHCGRVVVCIYLPLNALNEIIGKGEYAEIGRHQHINEKQHKILSIPETHTIVDPRAVMIHI